ncbi:two-component regulator propeller domain-containing protein [Flammeovirga sp. SubArs3]|uniref:type IX secretion system anionic LPS delivery protein PorZ n=1 Tax=Flammeovirga sp. SubArs3 TaxID=2995316 RepID=UPI00248BAEAC|nr:two-component regulator propeller domain-containing protein [Flammeovirga sp. SubArs3]
MNNRNYLYFFIFSILKIFSSPLFAQDIPVNSWRAHLNYSNAHSVAIADNEVFSASTNALFSYEKESGIISTITKDDGLSDTNILTLGYAAPTDQLVVLYSNGNIDFITESEIVNMRTLLNSNYPDKVFYGLRMEQQFMYVCASFGVVKINTTDYVIEETYDFIGQNGSENAVYDISFSEDSIYIASAEGIKRVADDEDTNKQDFNNWETVVSSSPNNITTLLYTEDGLYFTDLADSQVKKRTNSSTQVILDFDSDVYLLDLWGENITLPTSNNIKVIDTNDNVSTWEDEKSPSPRQILDDEDNIAWIADEINGLVRVNNNTIESYAPAGPLYPTAHEIIHAEDQIFLTPAEDNNLSVGSFSVFNDGQWTNYTSLERSNAEEIPQTAPMLGLAFMPAERKVYFATQGDGIMTFHIDDHTTEIIKDPFLVEGRTEAVINSLAIDQWGNLWTTTQGWLHFRDPAGEWQHFRDSNISSAAVQMENSLQGDVWMILGNQRLLTFKDGDSRFLDTDQTNGGLPSNTTLSLSLDNNGSMWIGTDDGTAEYFGTSPTEVGEFSVSLPRYDGFPLLKGEKVQAIAIDGGNRKWLGTGRGLWLFSSDGGRLYQQFTTDNSPLLSNNIITMDIQPVSGELFIGTQEGIISYRSDATTSSGKFENVKVFPSPVRPEYQGVLTISGLVTDASVKITDTAGNLVWDGQSFGGSTSWNLRLNNGQKPATGVYFIFSTDNDGNEKYVGKFAIVR